MRNPVVLLVVLLAAAPASAQVAPPFAVGGDPSVDPAAFRVTLFADGVDFPLGMVALDDGSLLVGVNRESFPGRVGRRTGSFVCPIRPEVTTPRGISA